MGCPQDHRNSVLNFGQIFTFNFNRSEIEVRFHLIWFYSFVFALAAHAGPSLIIIMIKCGSQVSVENFCNSLRRWHNLLSAKHKFMLFAICRFGSSSFFPANGVCIRWGAVRAHLINTHKDKLRLWVEYRFKWVVEQTTNYTHTHTRHRWLDARRVHEKHWKWRNI